MAGEAKGMAHVMGGIVQDGRVGKAGAENEEAANEKRDDTGENTVGEGKRNA